ncbi:lysophospholipase L1-like esterase [Archangium gephyra]|uniref:Lysophospholipase L1-like esterase n=1 Tax=Archangium gephyra TaxID=48 RepID=A0AAC8QH59_9BACT|nr:GDSL-type esterase/lipase family protein [Archangium gephyra]AKJ07391.1 Putative secreted protein [Archangium gephyra]REG26790.1 lysophospholipase L1-like esterase [Archangium gephyra]
MRSRRRVALRVGLGALLMLRCGPVGHEEETFFPPEDSAPASSSEALPAGGLEVAPVRDGRDPGQPRPVAPLFQPGFHLALRWSHAVGGLTTFRLRVPVNRAGQRVRLAFRSGDGPLALRRVTVALAGSEGALESAPVPVTFSGAPGLSVATRTRVVSDPVSLPLQFGDELAVSFEVEGTLAASAIELLPGSAMRPGAWATVQGPLGGTPWAVPVGLATVEVEGPPARAFVALGDSITEGYIDGHDDLRDTWAFQAGAQLGVPIVNAGVSGQGFYDGLRLLDGEALILSGITDCIVLLGTNDLSGAPDSKLLANLVQLTERLKPFCRTWTGTLLPKEYANNGKYEQVKSSRLVMNAWIREHRQPDIIDFEAVTRAPDNVHHFLDGLDVDGIHPSAAGHRVMADEVVRVLRANGVQPPRAP